VEVPTLGAPEAVTIPQGTQTGTTLRLKGRGMPDVSGRGVGDLHVSVRGVTPRKLTKEQKKLLEQLAATMPAESHEPTPVGAAEDRGIFERVKDIFG
jgi:molecular chaperone DnaJ